MASPKNVYTHLAILVLDEARYAHARDSHVIDLLVKFTCLW